MYGMVLIYLLALIPLFYEHSTLIVGHEFLHAQGIHLAGGAGA